MPNWQHIETYLVRVLTRDSSYWRLLKETHNPDGVKLQVQKMIERARGRPESPPFRDPVKVDELNAAQGPFYRETSARSAHTAIGGSKRNQCSNGRAPAQICRVRNISKKYWNLSKPAWR